MTTVANNVEGLSDGTTPTTGKVQTKMSFVQQVDDVFAGCGVYKRLAA